jgi:uncharacterized protein YndB with AHSA1/START domain
LPDIRKLVLINAPIGQVWEYISSAEGIASWWRSSTFEPVLGHEFIFHAGNFGDSPCKVTQFDPPKGRHARVGFDWGKDWHLTFKLNRFSTVTEFKLIHSGWDASKVTDFGQKHTVVRDTMDSEWEKIVTETLPAVIEERRHQKSSVF